MTMTMTATTSPNPNFCVRCMCGSNGRVGPLNTDGSGHYHDDEGRCAFDRFESHDDFYSGYPVDFHGPWPYIPTAEEQKDISDGYW